MADERNNLPIYGYKDQLLDMVKNNSVVIVRGQTGSGKTTQVTNSGVPMTPTKQYFYYSMF